MQPIFLPRRFVPLILLAGLGCLDVGALRGGPGGQAGGGTAGTGDGGVSGASGAAGRAGAGGAGGAAAMGPPRLIAPLSTSRVTSQRPTLKWSLASGTDGAQIQICRDRACTRPVTSFNATGSSAALPSALSPGVFFWRAAGRSGAMTGSALSATWEFVVGARSAATDSSWGTILDVNGDGYADAAVGEPELGSRVESGRVYLYYGDASGLTTPATAINGGLGLVVFGTAVASAGDVNGDGYGDLIVGSVRPGGVAPGSVSLFLGGPAGLVTPAKQSIDGDSQAYGYGASVSGVGDVNGDGYADVLVGAPYATPSDAGAAFLYLGGPGGLTQDVSFFPAGTDGALGQFGAAVSGAGDVDGDGLDDFLVGAPGANGGLGLVHLFRGTANASFGESIEISPPAGAAAGGQFGASLAGADDVDGDGLADLVVGEPDASGAGPAYLYLASALGSVAPNTPTSLTPAATLAGGVSVAGAGDVNGDGYSDVVTGGTTSAWLTLGAPPAVLGSASMSTTQLLGGTAVAGAGDINGDGYADVLTTLVGALMVYAGSATGVGSSPMTYLDPNLTYDTFGGLVAGLGDVNGDRFDDLAVGGSIYEGAASGVSRSPSVTISASGTGPVSQETPVGVGDINGDHYDDAFLSIGGEFAFFPGGVQGLPQSTSVGLGASDSLAGVGDVNHDGYPDFVAGYTMNGDQEEARSSSTKGGRAPWQSRPWSRWTALAPPTGALVGHWPAPATSTEMASPTLS